MEQELRKLQTKIKNAKSGKGQENDLTKFCDQEKELRANLRMLSGEAKTQRLSEAEELKKRKLKDLNAARVIVSTLSSSGHELLKQLTYGFETVIIDESGQAVELTTLIPLQKDCRHCILVGDPKQLPATVVSKHAAELMYTRPLFDRIISYPRDFTMLKVQYRMHPEIRKFPSDFFYNGQLRDGYDSRSERFLLKMYDDVLLRPFVVFDLSYGSETKVRTSMMNESEAEFIGELCKYILNHKDVPASFKVGIISPYAEQIRLIRRVVTDLTRIQVSTVDSFQGQEMDLIILSSVRASGRGIGFVADLQRLNVSLTRARFGLYIVGDLSTLKINESWGFLIESARIRNCIIQVPSPCRTLFEASKYAVSAQKRTRDSDTAESRTSLKKYKNSTSLSK
jgi:senataxin